MIRTVTTHTTAIEAHIVRCRLEHEGIPASVAFEHHVWAMWSYSAALGGVKVQVPEAFLESSKAIVQKIYLGEYEAELNTDELKPDVSTCPKCSSEKVKPINWSWKLSLIFMFLFAPLPLPYTRHLYKCISCSNKWIAQEQRGNPLSAIFLIMLAAIGALFVVFELWKHWCKLNCESSYVF